MFEKSEKKSSYVNAKYVTFPRISIIIDIILTKNSHHINIRKKSGYSSLSSKSIFPGTLFTRKSSQTEKGILRNSGMRKLRENNRNKMK